MAAAISQMVLMAAIVATLLYFPVGLVLALALAFFGVPLAAFVTFGGALGTYAGMLAWWLVVFVPTLVYAAFAFPWPHTEGFDGRRTK
jgi:hypothetical protein